MKKAALHNLGCKVNAYETEAMHQMLEEAGYEIVPWTARADVYVINTCSVTNIADRKSRQMLHRVRRQNPEAVIVACGCYVQAFGEELVKEGIADVILGNNKKQYLVSMLAEYEKQNLAPGPVEYERLFSWEDINDGKRPYEPLAVKRMAEHTRAFIKVQDGCNQFCSYCIIPYTRGRVRSRGIPDILEEIRTLAAAGCKEIVLTGIHLSSYGTDTGSSLLDLIRQVHEVPGICRIRLGSLEPGIVSEEFAAALAGMKKICPHFHLSLQSGCDTVLKRMNRKYDTAQYQMHCDILRQYFAHPAITTDVIVGFPGETAEEYEAGKHFLEQVRFYEMHVFKYSRRKGTKAAEMENQVSEQEKALRSAQLIELSKRMSEEYRESLCGQACIALLEEPFAYEGKNYYTGYTKEYVRVAVESKKGRENCIAEGKIIRKLVQDTYLMVEF